MLHRKVSTLAILAAFMAAFFMACGTIPKPVSEMSTKEKAVFFMKVYSDQAENYKTLAASPDLTEAQRSVLRDKKKIMEEVYPLISLYSDYVDAGAVPDAGVEKQIIGYLDRLAQTVTE